MGIVGIGIEAVVPKAVVKSPVMVGAEYPDGALVTVVVVTAYEVADELSSRQAPEPYALSQEYHCSLPLSVHMAKSLMVMSVQGTASGQMTRIGPRFEPSASVPFQLLNVMLLSWTPSPSASDWPLQWLSMLRE